MVAMTLEGVRWGGLAHVCFDVLKQHEKHRKEDLAGNAGP